MPTLRIRRGFALPLALLVMVVLTAGIAAGYTATSAEIVTNAAHRGDTRAFNVAQAGLETFLARRQESGFCTNSITGITNTRCLPDPTAATADSEYATIALNGGTAVVVSKLVRKYITDTLPAIYFIRS